MSMTLRMLASWRNPRAVMRTILSEGKREDRALVTIMAAAAIMFVAQWPDLARKAYLDPSIPLEGRLSAALMSFMFMMPLVAYIVSALLHLVMRVCGGRGSFYTARMAFFWALLCTAPFMLLHGLVLGFIGPGAASNLIGALVFLGFLYQWINAVIVAEGPDAMLSAE